MPTPTEPILLQRIDALTGQLNSTVTRTGGAAFALTLSLIYQAQQLVSSAGAARAEAGSEVVTRLARYTPEMVGRLGQAVQSGQRGELAMLVSWLETVPALATPSALTEVDKGLVPLSQAGVLSKGYSMLDEIRDASVSVAA